MEVTKRSLTLDSGPRVIRTISIDPKVWEKLNEVARSQGVSRNRFVEEIAKETIDMYEASLSEIA
jgi:predicted DNA-binding ribbon-helix-helix protein